MSACETPAGRYVHVCTACGNHTDQPCTDMEAIEEYAMVFDPEFEGGGPAWWCQDCV